jgi:hypothetical protein
MLMKTLYRLILIYEFYMVYWSLLILQFILHLYYILYFFIFLFLYFQHIYACYINTELHGTEMSHTGCRHKTDCPYGIKNNMNIALSTVEEGP